MNDIKIVKSLQEITEPNVKYAHISKPHKWIRIDKEKENKFYVYGMVAGDLPTSITSSSWNNLKEWRTFKGVIKSLTLFSKNMNWGMSHWNNK